MFDISSFSKKRRKADTEDIDAIAMSLAPPLIPELEQEIQDLVEELNTFNEEEYGINFS